MLVLITLLSVSGIVVAFALHGWSDLALIAVPCTLACIFLWVRRAIRARRAAKNWLILDGSNIMHWQGGTPQIETLREVVQHISSQGFSLGVVFDANAGYLLADKYVHDSGFGRILGLPEERVMVVPKGTPADPTILAAARDLNAKVVTNDRFRDWAESYPEVSTPGFLIRGGYRSGRLWLDLNTAAKG